ncbi:MAG: hypothetical protein LBV33_03970 [Lachnospiraceae bacterium]|jgi:hypothetical protein|nr:hypothetical protein [Lachnospiraceae bacterium]
MEKKIQHIRNGIAELLVYLIFAMVEQFIFVVLFGKAPGFWRLFFPLIVPLLFYVVRCRIHRFWLFLVLHLLATILMSIFYGRTIVEKVILGIATFIQMIISLSIRIAVFTSPERKDYGVHVVSPVASLIFATILLLIRSESGLAPFVIVYIIGYFIYYYLTQYIHYIGMNKRTTGTIPVNEIFKTDLYLVGGFTIICGIMMAGIAGRSNQTGLFGVVLQLVRQIFFSLFNLINAILPSPFINSVTQDQPLPANDIYGMLPVEGPSWFVYFLNGLFLLIGIALMLLLLAVGIYGIVVLFRAVFAKQVGPGQQIYQSEVGDTVERLERKSRSEKGEGGYARTPEEKIRKAFRNCMLRGLGRKPEQEMVKWLHSATARELLVYFNGEEGINKFIELYEKARYTKGLCTNDDVREARRLARRVNVTIKTGSNAYDSGKEVRKL